MSGENVTTSTSVPNSGHDSPMAGAVSPVVARRISDLGTAEAGNVEGMQMLDGLGRPQVLGEVRPFNVEPQPGDKMVDLTKDEGTQQPSPDDKMQLIPELQADADPNKQPNTQPEAGSDAELAAKWRDFEENPEIDIDVHGDKIFWYDSDGKGSMVPMRLKDLQGNILMFNDYQRKTSEVAEIKRQVERQGNGYKLMVADLQSEDPNVQLRAIRTMANPQAFERMVINYIQERAHLEKLDPVMRQRVLDAQRLEDENFFLRRREQRQQEQEQLRRQQEQEQLGVQSPDIVFVQEQIGRALPEVQKELGISDAEYESDAFQYELERVFTRATNGVKDAQGRWTEAPVIQRGRAPSKALIKQLVLTTKQTIDSRMSNALSRRVKPPAQTAPTAAAPMRGGGPAAQQGQRGNISQPQRLRWSDMGKSPARG